MRSGAWGRWRWLWPLAAVAACLTSALAGAGSSAAADATPTTLRVLAGSFPDSLDPQLSYTTEGWTAMYDTYIPLLTYRHATGQAGSQIVPGLARRLPRVTDGGRTYTLFLRRGLRYSNGKPVRASDFEYAVKRMFRLRSGGASFYAVIAGARRFRRTGHGGIGGIVADDGTGKIVIHLVRPSGTFSDLLALPFAAPVPRGTPMRDLSASPPPATGPYAIDGSVPGIGWSYARNPAWESGNGRRLPQLPGGHLDRIEVRVTRAPAAGVRAVMAGRADWLLTAPPASWIEKLRRRYSGTRFRVDPALGIYYFWMNTTRPPFDDLRVREAANYAVDRKVLAGIYGGLLAPTSQILPPGVPGFRRFDPFPHDLAKARRLVAAANPTDREITVWTDTESPNAAAAAYFAAQLRRIGFHVHLKKVGPFSYFGAVGNPRRQGLDAGFGNWFADYDHPDDFLRPLLLGSSIHRFYNENLAQLDVPGLDAKVRALDGRPLGSAAERGYARLDRAYTKLAPWVPFGTPVQPTFVSKDVDLAKVAVNPLFGADLASFRFR